MSGRVASVDVVTSRPNTIYVGAATGGVWRSVDGGISWEPIFDDQPLLGIGAVAVSPVTPDLIWVGTGEGNPRNSAGVGNGVFKSLDGGESWRHMGDHLAAACASSPEALLDGHASATMHTLWGSLAAARAGEEAFRAYMDYNKWWLVSLRSPKND